MGSTLCTATRYFKPGFIGGKGTSKINALRITSDFGMRKKPNEPDKTEMHHGIDFGVPSGTQLFAPVDGRIIKVIVQNGGAGLYVVEEYVNQGGEKFYIYFMHLSDSEFYNNPDKLLPYDIKEGELIGKTGGGNGDKYKGSSTGPHLHLEIRRGSMSPRASTAIDPKYFFMMKHFMNYAGTTKYIDNEMFINGAVGVDGDYFCAEDIEEHYNVKTVIDTSIPKTIDSETEVSKVKKKIKTDANERLALGIWQITKLLLDGDVQDKQVTDATLSTQTGSLINYFNKVCQKPFVEFFGETFGNQYYWIARRPPFDEQGFTRMYNLLIDISDNDIVSKNVQWENSEIYSWYQYLPTGIMLSGSESLDALMPAVFFPEYAAVWGSKPLCVQSNYYDLEHSGVSNSDLKENGDNINRIYQNVVKDFRFIIESNAYKPFSRSGSVTINGMQKIKRGMLIRFSNGEIFHVDGVSNSFIKTLGGVNRTTTIQISHGIFDTYLHKKNTGSIYGEVSYFNIIDFGDYKIEDIDASNYYDVISKWKVNEQAFNFFLNRNQLKVRDQQINL